MTYDGDQMVFPRAAASAPTCSLLLSESIFCISHTLSPSYSLPFHWFPFQAEQETGGKSSWCSCFDAISSSLTVMSQKDPYWKGKVNKGRQGKKTAFVIIVKLPCLEKLQYLSRVNSEAWQKHFSPGEENNPTAHVRLIVCLVKIKSLMQCIPITHLSPVNKSKWLIKQRKKDKLKHLR